MLYFHRMKRAPIIKRIAFGFLAVSISLGGIAFQNNYFELNKQLEIFAAVYREINQNYVDEQKPSELMDVALNAMLSSLDPYTNYIPESYVEDFRSQSAGQYGGVGAEIRPKGDYPVIASIKKEEAADKAGLRVGDLILEVADLEAKKRSMDEVSRLLKGAPGTKVELLIERAGKQFKKTIVRSDIIVKNVPHYAEIAPGIGYIYLSQFSARASDEVKAAYEAMSANGKLKGLILDLRGNPGGLLNEAVNVSNLFIDKGKEVVRTKGKVKEASALYSTMGNPIDTEIPLAILINGQSASASEIVAGVIQDYDRGIVLGQRSFGKGLVQQSKPMNYGTQLKLTIAKYYTPSGRCIQAINYSERDETGRVKSIPDSLRKVFYTQKGRPVLDGGGVDPDLAIQEKDIPPVLYGLLEKELVFDFVNEYHADNLKMEFNPSTYAVDKNTFNAFASYAKKKNFTFETYTEEVLKELELAYDKEGFDNLESEVNKLRSSIETIKKGELDRHQDLIMRWLGGELALRYSYDKGQVIYNLRFDEASAKAVTLLNSPTEYQNLLSLGEK